MEKSFSGGEHHVCTSCFFQHDRCVAYLCGCHIFHSRSFYTAFIQTLICAVILQTGYFIAILVLVAREKRRMRETFLRDRGAENVTADTASSAPPHGAKLTDM